jgi:formiminoglutamase
MLYQLSHVRMRSFGRWSTLTDARARVKLEDARRARARLRRLVWQHARVVSRFDPSPAALPVDDRWPRAGHWLAAGPGERAIDLAVLGVPAFTRSIRPSGTRATPIAVRRALHHFTTWCASRHVDLSDLYPWDLGDVQEPDADDGEWRTTTMATTAFSKGRAVVALGGDGTITFPVVSAAGRLDDAGLVMLDAFYDVRDGVGNCSSLRRLIDVGLRPERVAHLGAADWLTSRSHADEVAARGIRLMSRGVVSQRGVDACMREALQVAGEGSAAVHVSFDFSVCERAAAPASLEAVAGGLAPGELLAAAFAAGRDSRVRSIDLVEIDATADAADQRTVRLAAMVVLEFAAGVILRA